MALRHPVPVFDRQLLGSGEGVVIPRLRNPKMVEFSPGVEAAKEFLRGIADADSVVVTAKCGAGKSVNMPVTLLGMFKLVIHVVPSRNLAGSLADYVCKIHPTAQVKFVDMEDEMPVTGLVITPVAVFARNLLRWMREGPVPSYCLYMDEAHESDWVTFTLRHLRGCIPGCDKFIMASATHGTGGAGEEFGAPPGKAKLTVSQFDYVDPREWDVIAPGFPWSVDTIDSDTIVFEDDPDMADIIGQKFAEEGFEVHVITSRTSIVEFRELNHRMKNKPKHAGMTVLIADYSYRFGFTFPTVRRIIDNCNVGYYTMVDAVHHRRIYRQAYMGEVVQTVGRLGRVPGADCVYFRPKYDPKLMVTDLEGSEADASPILFRALGFVPPRMLRGTPYYSGGLPRGFERVLAGKTPLRSYAADRIPWAEDKKVDGVRGISPDRVSDRTACSGRSQSSAVAGEKKSFTNGEKCLSGTLLRSTLEQSLTSAKNCDDGFSELKKPSTGVAAGTESADRRLDKDHEPYIDDDDGAGDVRTGVTSSGFCDELLGTLDALAGHKRHKRSSFKMSLGSYYYVPGVLDLKFVQYSGFSEVSKRWGRDLGLLASAGADVRVSVLSHAVHAFNRASATVSAAKFALEKVPVVAQNIDGKVVSTWASWLRGEVQVSQARAAQASEMVRVLATAPPSEVAPWAELETECATMMLKKLKAMLETTRVDDEARRAFVEASHARVRRSVRKTIEPRGYDGFEGRLSLQLGSSLRHRVAKAILGNDKVPGVAIAPEDPWGDKYAKRLAARFERNVK